MSEELQAEIDRLRKANFQLREGAEEQKRRIKRLEEAGDALYENSDPTRFESLRAVKQKLDAQEAWLRAKEAKP